MSFSAATLLLPAPDTNWRVWKPRAASPGDAVDSPADFTDRSKPLVVGLPASACRSIGMILPQSDHDVLEQMVCAQLEKRGIKTTSEHGKNFRLHQLGASGPLAIVSVDVLADPFPEHLAVTHASDYTAALRLSRIPDGKIVVVEEQGDLIVAAGYQGHLFHSHIIGQQPMSATALAQEIAIARLALESQQGFGGINGVTLKGIWDKHFASAVSEYAELPVDVTQSFPAAEKADTRGWSSLLPSAVRAAQASSARRRKITRFTALGILVFSALAVLAVLYLSVQEKTATKLEEEVASTAPAAAAVRKTMGRWKALAPALEQPRFALVQLNDITSLMPPSGIVVRKYEAKLDEIEIRGEAREARLADQFIEDIKKHKNLSRYEWSMPRPEVKTTASFRAQGKLKP